LGFGLGSGPGLPTISAQMVEPASRQKVTKMYSGGLVGTIDPTPPPTCSIAT